MEAKKSNLYTRTGDCGMTSLVGGERVSKTCDRLEAYGTVDEFNSFIGLLAANSQTPSDVKNILLKIQNKLFNLGAYLATDNKDGGEGTVWGFGEDDVTLIEKEIDRLDSIVPPLRAFVLPGGSEVAALAHVCRTVCRRTERRLLTLAETVSIAQIVLQYFNRLSDYFFVLARFLNVNAKIDEIFWQKT